MSAGPATTAPDDFRLPPRCLDRLEGAITAADAEDRRGRFADSRVWAEAQAIVGTFGLLLGVDDPSDPVMVTAAVAAVTVPEHVWEGPTTPTRATALAAVAALSAELDYDRHEFDPEINPATGKPSMWCQHFTCGGRTQANDRIHRTVARILADRGLEVTA